MATVPVDIWSLLYMARQRAAMAQDMMSAGPDASR